DVAGNETVPPVAITVVDESARAEDLLHTGNIFARHADYHIRKFSKAKHLLHDRPHGDIAGVFFREAQRDAFRERHAEGIMRRLSRASRDGRARGRGQIRFDDGELLGFFAREFGAVAFGELLDRLFALLYKRLENLNGLSVVERAYFFDFFVFDGRFDPPQDAEAQLIFGAHGVN